VEPDAGMCSRNSRSSAALCSQHQNQLGAEGISGGQRAGLGNTVELQLPVFLNTTGLPA
jgi:hypothetical protein